MPSTPAPSQPAPSQPARRAPAPAARPLPVAPTPQDTIPPLPEPAAEPPAAAPSAPVDDMPLPTETPAAEPAAPAETPAKPAEDVEDLFKDTDTKPGEAPADTTPAKPADKADDVEDLFKETDEKKAATSEPAQEEPMNPAPTSEVEDLFSEPTDKPSTSASLDAKPAEELSPMRLWTDNTGKYQVRARLLVVGDRYVRLLKETGRTTTVPFSRLSGSDLAFVQHQVSSELAGNF
jgi:SLA1 Homology Domain 1 (SHD1) protein